MEKLLKLFRQFRLSRLQNTSVSALNLFHKTNQKLLKINSKITSEMDAKNSQILALQEEYKSLYSTHSKNTNIITKITKFIKDEN